DTSVTRSPLSFSLLVASSFYHLFLPLSLYSLFFFNPTSSTHIYTLSLHDALPISLGAAVSWWCVHRNPSSESVARMATHRNDLGPVTREPVHQPPGRCAPRSRSHQVA